jgi:hypothetical protein
MPFAPNTPHLGDCHRIIQEIPGSGGSAHVVRYVRLAHQPAGLFQRACLSVSATLRLAAALIERAAT